MLSQKKRIYITLVLFCVTTILSLAAYAFGVFDTFEERIIDRFFTEREASNDVVIIAVDDESIRALGQWPWPRETFATLIQKLDSAAVVGIDVHFSEPSRHGDGDDETLARALGEATPTVILPLQVERGSELLLTPLSQFASRAEVGVTNVELDADGIARYARRAYGDTENFGTVVGRASIAPEIVRIAYVGPEKTFTTFPVVDVLDDSLPERFIENKTILVGATAADLQDFVQTPFGRMPGVEYHANVLTTARNNVHFKDIPLTVGLLTIVCINGLAAALVFFVRRFVFLLASLAGLFLMIGAGAVLLFGFFVVVPVLYLLFGLALTAGVLILYQYIFESEDRKFIHDTFQYYLPPDVIDEISRDPSKLTLGGEKRKITILFSDIRGFTTISEALTPEELMEKLNVYLTEMTEAVMERRGIVDKYIGDAVMAFWGAPLKNETQTIDAAESAIDMIRRLEKLNEEWKKEGELPFQIGIGISTGEVVVGNMGSRQRFNYTIIGDEVNFSARLEGLTKPYGVNCLIGESTKEEIENTAGIHVREIDLVMVKGKKEPRRIYELLTTELTEDKKQILAHFREGREHYNNGKWQEAIDSFEAALAVGEDGPSKTFLERSQELQKDPPESWNGVYEFTTK